MLSSGGTAVFVGPTALLLYKAYALQGGVQFPVYHRASDQPERLRFGVNVSYFFWVKMKAGVRMNRAGLLLWVLAILLLAPVATLAEFRRVELKILGMD